MVRIILMVVIFSVVSCNHQKKESKEVQPTASYWTEFLTKDSIPNVFLIRLSSYLSDDFKIANPDERFNATDIINDSLPQKQLEYLAKSGHQWRLCYIQGGFAKYYVYVEGTISGDSIIDFKIAKTLTPLNNSDSINALLKNNLIKFEE